MNHRNQESLHDTLDQIFYSPSNFEMLISLIKDTLMSRYNIKFTEATFECVKTNLLDIMKFIFDHRSELQTKEPMSLSEYNLVMNKQVLDIAIEKLPKVIQKNMSCRPVQSGQNLHNNVENAFKKIQDDRNALLNKPKNPFVQEHINIADQTSSSQKMNSITQTAATTYVSQQTQKPNTESNDNIASYNDTEEILSFLNNSENTEPTMSLADTIQQFNKENDDMELKGDTFVAELEKKLQKREQLFQESTALNTKQEKILQHQIEEDRDNSVHNVYPMDEANDSNFPTSLNSHTNLMPSTPLDKPTVSPKTVIEWNKKHTTVQLSSADRQVGQNRYDYTIDTSLFETDIKHIVSIQIQNLVVPAYEMSTLDAHSFGQYLLLDIPELNSHNVGSNTALRSSQCMLFVDKQLTSSASRGCVILRNENETKTEYAKNVMRQLPRQLTIRMLHANGVVFGNELTYDNITINTMSTSGTSFIIETVDPFAVGVQLRVGDTIRMDISINGTTEMSVCNFLNRKKGHVITDFGPTKDLANTPATEKWSKTLHISALDGDAAGSSIIPSWSETDDVSLSSTMFISYSPDEAVISGSIMNLSVQNTLSLVVTSKSPTTQIFQQE